MFHRSTVTPTGVKRLFIIFLVSPLVIGLALWGLANNQQLVQPSPTEVPTAHLRTPVLETVVAQVPDSPLTGQNQIFEWSSGSSNTLKFYPGFTLILTRPDGTELSLSQVGRVGWQSAEVDIQRFRVSRNGLDAYFDTPFIVDGVGVAAKPFVTIPSAGWKYRYEKEKEKK